MGQLVVSVPIIPPVPQIHNQLQFGVVVVVCVVQNLIHFKLELAWARLAHLARP